MRLDSDLLEWLELFRPGNIDFPIVGGHAVAFHGHPHVADVGSPKNIET